MTTQIHVDGLIWSRHILDAPFSIINPRLRRNHRLRRFLPISQCTSIAVVAFAVDAAENQEKYDHRTLTSKSRFKLKNPNKAKPKQNLKINAKYFKLQQFSSTFSKELIGRFPTENSQQSNTTNNGNQQKLGKAGTRSKQKQQLVREECNALFVLFLI